MSTQDSEYGRWVRSVVEQYEGPLLRYATRITGDLEQGRDVVQDTFLRLCREDRSRVDGYVAEWLYTVCRNRALDVRRKEHRMTTITEKQAAGQQSREKPQTVTAEEQDSMDQIQRVLAKLTDNQQEVVRLKFQDGLSYKEISRVTELSVSNVGYIIHTTIHKIRKELQLDCS